MSVYIPRQGDVVWIDFDPQVGYEQAKRRPALVLSTTSFASQTNLAVVCPVTNTVRGHNFEIPVPDNSGVTGVIRADQVKSLDWRGRNTAFMCQLPLEIVAEVVGKVMGIFR